MTGETDLAYSLFCCALYDYEAQYVSGLSFRRNDVIEVLTQAPSGWWDGLLGERRGWFPSNYVATFCRGLYDYETQNASSLAFHRDDIIMVVTQDPSGWWDGVLGDKRGWFPSNYVAVISDKDAVEAASVDALADDFWVPELSCDGRVYYVNTKTGQHAQDSPHESSRSIRILAESLNSTRLDGISNVDNSTIQTMEADSSVESRDAHFVSKSSPTPQPELPPPYPPTDILIDPDGSVRAGTVPALVELLTSHEQENDPTFFNSFLMTFKSFTTVDELFELLVQRFRIQPPPKMSKAEREDWLKWKHGIQSRILNAFKSMVVDDGVLEKDDMFILDRMKEFLATEEAVNFPAAKQLLTLIEQKGSDTGIEVVTPPLVLQSSKELKPLDIDPVELARQLTIKESQLYRRIRPLECLQQAHGKTTENGPNITNFIQNTNKIQLWFAGCILSEEDLPQRAKAVEHAINVADCCRSLNNFSTMSAITSGLNSPPVRRLNRTWKRVHHNHMALFKTCEETISNHRGFVKYRSLINSASPPCVPFIGISLTNLRFIQDGMPDEFPAKDGAVPTLINFRKRRKAWEVINDMKRWHVPYNLDEIPSIQAYIGDSLNSISDATESGFWEKSLQLEPRKTPQTEDEKMAQLLEEHGFL